MESIFLQITPYDTNFLSFLKPIISGRAKVSFSASSVTSIMEVVMRATEKGCTQIATTSPKLLQLLLGKLGEKLPSVDDYAGSIIEKFGFEFLILNPIEHIVTVPYGKHLYDRYLKKFTDRAFWLPVPEFTWEVFKPENTDTLLAVFESATFISVDIETGAEADRVITCVGFTAVKIDSRNNSYTTRTVVVPFIDAYNIAFVRVILSLQNPKVLQNGKYDNAYLLRYNSPLINYAFDTAHMFHAWYSEFPKRLDFIISYTLRKWQFWKDESKTSDLMDYYRYNAKDAFVTAVALLALLQEMPQWALDNFIQEMPLVFPCLTTELTGLKRDQLAMEAEETRFNLSLEVQLSSLRRMLQSPHYNPSSAQQTLRLFEALGSGDIPDTTPPSRDKVAARHPINKRLVNAIEKYRKDRKLVTSYLRDYNPKEKRFKSWNGRIYYALNPHGTDTARLASKESAFWCGWQIQNIPRDRKDIQVKRGIVADNGYYLGEADYKQNEARGTGYLSGDTALITAVEGDRDFHAANASAFFGVPFESIIGPDGSVIDAELRDLSKRTNHGSNYNMGAGVLLDTMGIAKVIQAKKLLRLPASYTLKQVCQHLLNTYETTYPVVKGPWYDKCKNDVLGTGFLIGPTGWTRRCFSNPAKSKHALNSYVAHPPQSLAAMLLNKAYLRVFYEIWLPNSSSFKMGPQIHDSILFQYKKDRQDLAWKVVDCMHNPVVIKDTFGISRVMTVPVDLKGENTRWSDLKKMTRLSLVKTATLEVA